MQIFFALLFILASHTGEHCPLITSLHFILEDFEWQLIVIFFFYCVLNKNKRKKFGAPVLETVLSSDVMRRKDVLLQEEPCEIAASFLAQREAVPEMCGLIVTASDAAEGCTAFGRRSQRTPKVIPPTLLGASGCWAKYNRNRLAH